MTDLTKFNGRHICQHCGCKAEQHRSSDGRCPPAGKPFPKFPHSVETKKGMDEAQLVWGKRLDTYWAKTKTEFFPR